MARTNTNTQNSTIHVEHSRIIISLTSLHITYSITYYFINSLNSNSLAQLMLSFDVSCIHLYYHMSPNDNPHVTYRKLSSKSSRCTTSAFQIMLGGNLQIIHLQVSSDNIMALHISFQQLFSYLQLRKLIHG